jgi:DNA helicase-2/ATP-dependent DNA helicase PcrA
MERLGALFEGRLRELNVTDFDGLLVNFERLLSGNPEAARALTSRFSHVLVDEYQDTTRLQSDIVELLAPTELHSLMVVGDDAQAIYSFRGARIENMLGFPERHPGCRIVRLTRNYRSSPQILNLANRVLSANRRQFRKDLETLRPPGPLPVHLQPRDGGEQAEFVAQRIGELAGEGSDLSGIAVLYRAHSHSLDIQVALTRAGIPFMVRSGVRFFEQAHIKDVLSLLRFIWNPSDEIALSRLLKLFPGIGNATASAAAAEMGGAAASMPGRILDEGYRPASIKGSRAAVGWDLFRRTLSAVLKPGGTAGPSPVIDEFVKEHYREAAGSRYPNAEERLEDIEQLSAFSSRHGEIGAFLREISLLTNIDVDRPSNPAAERSGMVTLSSVHQAKGLEWRAVFVVWLCDGRFPSSLALKDPAGEEEERRLFYVAITRAKDDLYLCQPLSEAGRDRMIKLMRPSRFISEIGDLGGLAERWNLEPAGRAERS